MENLLFSQHLLATLICFAHEINQDSCRRERDMKSSQPQTDETKHQLNLTEETGIALDKDATISGFGQFNSKSGSLIVPCKNSGRFIYISLDHEWPEDVIDANNNAEKEKYGLWITVKGKVHQYHAKNGPGTTDPPNPFFQDRGRDDGEYIFENNSWEVLRVEGIRKNKDKDKKPFLILDLTKKKKPKSPNPPQLSPVSGEF